MFIVTETYFVYGQAILLWARVRCVRNGRSYRAVKDKRRSGASGKGNKEGRKEGRWQNPTTDHSGNS